MFGVHFFVAKRYDHGDNLDLKPTTMVSHTSTETTGTALPVVKTVNPWSIENSLFFGDFIILERQVYDRWFIGKPLNPNIFLAEKYILSMINHQYCGWWKIFLQHLVDVWYIIPSVSVYI